MKPTPESHARRTASQRKNADERREEAAKRLAALPLKATERERPGERGKSDLRRYRQ